MSGADCGLANQRNPLEVHTREPTLSSFLGDVTLSIFFPSALSSTKFRVSIFSETYLQPCVSIDQLLVLNEVLLDQLGQMTIGHVRLAKLKVGFVLRVVSLCWEYLCLLKLH